MCAPGRDHGGQAASDPRRADRGPLRGRDLSRRWRRNRRALLCRRVRARGYRALRRRDRRPRRGNGDAGGQALQAAFGQGGGVARGRLPSGGPQETGDPGQPVARGEFPSGRAVAQAALLGHRPARGAPAHGSEAERTGRQVRGCRPADRHPERRQSAEGPVRAHDADPPAARRDGGSHCGGQFRLQG